MSGNGEGKLPPEDLVRAVLAFEDDGPPPPIDRPEEVDAALRERGFDPEVEAARGEALAAEILAKLDPRGGGGSGGSKPGPVHAEPAPPPRPRLPPLLTIGGVALVVAAAIALALHARPSPAPPAPVPEPPPPAPKQLPAPDPLIATLLPEAHRACAEKRWEDCASTLDAVQKLDPAVAATPEVRALRDAIAAGRSEKRPHDKVP